MHVEQLKWSGPQSFGQAFLRERERLKLSRRDVARRTGASEREIIEWERDARFPTTHQLTRLFGSMASLKALCIEARSEPVAIAKIGDAVQAQMRKAAPRVAPPPLHVVPEPAPVEEPVKAPEVVQEAPEAAAEPEVPPPVSVEEKATPREESLVEMMARVGARLPFSAALRLIRHAEELRQEDVADLVGVSPSAVGSWELEESIPVEECYRALLGIFPKLAEAERPAVRAIAKPIGNPYGKQSKPPAPEMPQLSLAPVTSKPLDAFAKAKRMARALTKVGPMSPELIAALRDLHDLGCSIADVLEWIDEGGAS